MLLSKRSSHQLIVWTLIAREEQNQVFNRSLRDSNGVIILITHTSIDITSRSSNIISFSSLSFIFFPQTLKMYSRLVFDAYYHWISSLSFNCFLIRFSFQFHSI